MTKLDHGHVLLALLGLGATDLAALNLWALPGAFTVTEADAASDELQPTAAPATAAVAVFHPQPPAAVAGPAVTPPAVAETVADSNALILFGRGSWSVGRRGRATLHNLLAGVSRERVWVELDGHADAAGPEDLNERISEQRARAAAAVLLRSGVAADQIQVRAFGERNPSHDGRSRRVEIRIRGAL
jgi:outer membrane protein OmpA-like peptidoglycan-associated protein